MYDDHIINYYQSNKLKYCNKWLVDFKYIKWILDNFNNFDWKIIDSQTIRCNYKDIEISINNDELRIYFLKNKKSYLAFSKPDLISLIYQISKFNKSKAQELNNTVYSDFEMLLGFHRNNIIKNQTDKELYHILNIYIKENVINHQYIYESL